MIVLDAFALLALFRDEAAAGTVTSLLAGGGCVINAVNLTEVLDRLARRDETDVRLVEGALSGLTAGPLTVLPVDEAIAWRAAAIRARHYHHRNRALSLADCIVVASARAGDSIATGDGGVAETARSEGIEVLTLPRG